MNVVQQINVKKDNYAQFRRISKKVVVWSNKKEQNEMCEN